MILDPFTPVFHELLEPLVQIDLSGVSLRIILWVIRNSYGRKQARYAAYSWRRVASELHADRRGVARAGTELLSRGILLTSGDGEIGINKAAVKSLAMGQLSQGDNRPRVYPHSKRKEKERFALHRSDAQRSKGLLPRTQECC